MKMSVLIIALTICLFIVCQTHGRYLADVNFYGLRIPDVPVQEKIKRIARLRLRGYKLIRMSADDFMNLTEKDRDDACSELLNNHNETGYIKF